MSKDKNIFKTTHIKESEISNREKDKCENCFYFCCDDENECQGQENICHEFINSKKGNNEK